MKVLLSLLLATSAFAADANRLAYLDSDDPYYPARDFPKLTTPQWIGEPGVEAAVILAIDDLRDPAKYEAFLRPILDRLKRIDGHAPLSIFTNTVPTDDPQLAAWLREGVTLENHTLTHPCPLLGKGGFEEAARTYHGGVDQLARIAGNRATAFRMPCCDSMDSLSPRFFAELFNRTSPEGRALAIDSSVFTIFSGERWRKYFPLEMKPPVKVTFGRYAGFIEDYPFPYVIGGACLEFPCMTPSDWQAFNALGPKTPTLLADWQAALDETVRGQGAFTFVFHPHGWSDPQQLVDFIDYAVAKYGPRVKFLNFREALERVEKNAFAGVSLRHPLDGGDHGVRLLDVDGDGFMDVMIGNSQRAVTRVWQPKEKRWAESETPVPFVTVLTDGPRVDHHVRFGIVRGATAMLAHGAWEWSGGKWRAAPELLKGLPAGFRTDRAGADAGVRLRDFDRDGRCELLVSNAQQNAIYGWSEQAQSWHLLDFALPAGSALTDAQGRDNGLRFTDLNGDGCDDVILSNEHDYAIHLWAKTVRDGLGWKHGWPHEVARHARDEATPPSFVRDGRNNGAWFHAGHLVVQNEDTAALEGVVWRRSFKELIAFPMPPPKSPADSLAAIRVRPGFKVELVASEPLVTDPIAFEWGADGKLWVVEMRDYPLGLDGKGSPGGVVKILEDPDGDGRYDKAAVFLDGLTNPTGLMPWRKGVLIAASPDIFYAEDTDGDGRADVRRVLFTGFKPGNQQHRLNGFDWGLDGWLYGANGDSGGAVKSLATGAETSISGRDFRFRPDTGEFETVSVGTQYGRHRDDWGEWFGNNNSAWLWHITTPEHYLRRNPQLAVKTTHRVLANYDDPTRVFAISQPLTRFNQPESLGHVTSANSAMPYRDELFGPDFATSVFISEPVHNVVHREVLAPDGPGLASHRADDERDREFLASTDHWFRPTMLKTGPDGALYIADMYRAVLEHPEWIAPETQERLDLRAGSDMGRIYRVLPENSAPRKIPNLANLDSASLAAALDSPGGWQRDTAQRLLFERGEKPAAPQIAQLAASAANPKVRVQALATLDVLGALTPAPLLAALKDAHPGVRAAAVRLSERLAGSAGELLPAIVGLEADPDPAVRRQLAFTLGAWRGVLATDTLARLAARDGADPLIRTAILSSVAPDSPLMAALRDDAKPAAVAALPKLAPTPSPDRAKVIATYAPVAELRGDAPRGRQLFQQTCAVCHRLKGDGNEVGPDLAMVAGKPLDWLLTAIFDPNAAVEARYQAYTITTKTGEALAGLIVAETANNLVLRAPGGTERAVLRSDVQQSQPLARSLMPDGLEAALKPQDLADLLAWLRAP